MAITITTFPDKLVASKNDSWVAVQTTDVNCVVRMEVYSLPADTKIASILAPVDSSNTALFNLKRILQSMGVLPDVLQPQLPAFDQLLPALSNNNIKKYYLKFFTVDKTTAADISTITYNSNLEVLLAGKNFINGNKNLITIIGDGTAQRKFLTCQPAEKKVSTTAQQYLYYYHNENGISSGAVSIALKVKILLDDNSTLQKILSSFTVSNFQLVIFPVGFSQLNLASYILPGKTAISYSVCVVLQSDTTKAITNTFNYAVDKRCFVRGRQFIYLNSLGGIDSLFVTDTQEAGMDAITEPAERMLQYNYNVHEGQYYNFYKQSDRTFKCTTDLLNYDERLYLQDFFMSTNVWEISDTDFIPVILTDTNYTLHKDRMELQNIQFSFRYAFDDVAYNNF